MPPKELLWSQGAKAQPWAEIGQHLRCKPDQFELFTRLFNRRGLFVKTESTTRLNASGFFKQRVGSWLGRN